MNNQDIDTTENETDASEAPGFDDGSQGDGAFVVAEQKTPVSKSTVAMFIIMALAGVGTYMMYVRSGPQSASAAGNPQAQIVIKQFMTDRDKNLNLMQKMLRDTESVVQQFLTYPSVTQIPLTDLRTNPFRAAPAATDEKTITTNARRDEEKELKRKEEERVTVLKSVQGLQLQSVVHSDSRKACMINNTLYAEGQQVQEFMIEKISPNAVIVRSGSYRFELRMQR